MDEDVLAGGVVPQEEGLAVFGAAVEEVHGLGRDLVVEGLHALDGELSLVLRGSTGGAGDDAARIELLLELRVGGAIRVLQVLVGVEVVEVAPELVEAVPAGQVLVEVAQVVLAVLGGGVALGLEDFGERDVLGLEAGRGAGGAHRGQPGTHRELAGDEGRTPRGAARLGVEGTEPQPLFADAVDVGGRDTHDVAAVGRDVHPADVIAEDDQDVGRSRPGPQRRGAARRAPPGPGWRG